MLPSQQDLPLFTISDTSYASYEAIIEDFFPTLQRSTEWEAFFSKSRFKKKMIWFIMWTKGITKKKKKSRRFLQASMER